MSVDLTVEHYPDVTNVPREIVPAGMMNLRKQANKEENRTRTDVDRSVLVITVRGMGGS